MALKEKTQIIAVKKALSYMEKKPEENLPKLLEWFEKFDVRGTLKKQLSVIRPVLVICTVPIVGPLNMGII